jgi:ABC-type lipopolysaccharide export system ATPase subunit
VQKSYRGRMVVKGVSIATGRGEAVGLLGPNGAGKTTVFYMITGLVPADAGSITLDWPRRDAAAHVPAGAPRASATCRRRPRSSAA